MASAANNTSNENVDEVAAAQTESDSIHSGSETAPNSNHRTDPPEGEGPEVEDVGNGPVAVSTAGPRVVQVQGLPLEWTQMGNNSAAEQQQQPVIRYPCDVMAMEAMDPTDTELCIVGTAGQKITHMGPTFFETTPNPASLTSLILRSHVIRKIEGLQGFINLELLELYDNQVDSLSTCFFPMDDGGCCPGRTLKILDMSYNSIRDMDPVAFCPNLQELYLANNKIKAMAGLKELSQLRKIDLGANRIRVMEVDELSGLVRLEELWLGKNKIELMQGIDGLKALRRLDVQSNRLVTVDNLTSQQETLEELYLSHNAITTEGASLATGLALEFSQLSILDLSRNQLTSCQPFGHLSTLEELWLSGNEIASFDTVEPLATLQLDTIYLEYNPLQSDPLYRKKLAAMIPSLKQIDANLIRGNEFSGGGTIAQYLPSTRAIGTSEEGLRRLQDMAVTRAHAETNGDLPLPE